MTARMYSLLLFHDAFVSLLNFLDKSFDYLRIQSFLIFSV